MASTLTPLASVQARIAQALLPSSDLAQVGRFTLRAPQREMLAAIHEALGRFGGALVADAPGSGKTVLALAAAVAYDDVLVLAPAALREQWLRAATRAGVSLRFASLEALSRGSAIRGAPLIIADEAHHLRTPATARYRAVAALARGRHLLLLSATPVVNRGRDRDALLALFLGARAAQASAGTLERVVLRRSHRAEGAGPVRRLPPLLGAPDVPLLGEMLGALPPPFPLADGSAATALVRISLAMAWSSSLAALDAALRRRLQRGQVLLERLDAGQWPSRDAVHAWLHGDDATQLALPLATSDLPAAAPASALPILRAHLDAVAAMRAHVAPALDADTQARAAALRDLLRRERPRRIVLLAHHAETVRALFRALRGEPGVVAITGARVHTAAGRWTREEVLAALGPAAEPWSAQDVRGIRLLLATDILAEGVELQGCATLVHGDPAWTPARLEQRVGRVAREGQRAPVHVTQFVLPAGVRPLLALGRRLGEKREARRAAMARADAASALHRQLQRWHRPFPPSDEPQVAAADAPHCGFLALLRDEGSGAALLLGGRHGANGWRVGTSADLLSQLAGAVGKDAPAAEPCLATARRLIQRWLHRERVRQEVQRGAGIPDALLRRARRRVTEWSDALPLAVRQRGATRAATLIMHLAALRGVGAEQLVLRALRERDAGRCVAALEALVTEAARVESPTTANAYRLSVLLLLRRRAPAAPAPPAPSPGSAATR